MGPYNQAVKAGGVLYCSGQIALDAATDMSTTIVTLGGGYAVVDNDRWGLDLVAGA